MDLANRKLVFIQTFLKVQDEVLISSSEQLLNEKQNQLNSFIPMTKERLNNEIDLALEDSKNKRLIEYQVLKRKMKSLR